MKLIFTRGFLIILILITVFNGLALFSLNQKIDKQISDFKRLKDFTINLSSYHAIINAQIYNYIDTVSNRIDSLTVQVTNLQAAVLDYSNKYVAADSEIFNIKTNLIIRAGYSFDDIGLEISAEKVEVYNPTNVNMISYISILKTNYIRMKSLPFYYFLNTNSCYTNTISPWIQVGKTLYTTNIDFANYGYFLIHSVSDDVTPHRTKDDYSEPQSYIDQSRVFVLKRKTIEEQSEDLCAAMNSYLQQDWKDYTNNITAGFK